MLPDGEPGPVDLVQATIVPFEPGREGTSRFTSRSLDHVSHDSPALGLAEESGKRRVLAKIVVVLALVNERPAYPRERVVQELLPTVGVALVDPALISPPEEHVPCFFNHRFAESSRDGPVVSETARTGAFVVASLSVLLKDLKIEALRRFAVTDHRRGQDISAIAVRAISLHGLVEIEDRRHGHLDTTLS